MRQSSTWGKAASVMAPKMMGYDKDPNADEMLLTLPGVLFSFLLLA